MRLRRFATITICVFAMAAWGCGEDEPTDSDHIEDGDPSLQMSSDSVEMFGEVGDDAEATITAENVGDAELTVEFEPRDAWLELAPMELTVDPDDEHSVDATAHCEEAGQRDTEITVASNDDSADGMTLPVQVECSEDVVESAELAIDVAGLPAGVDADISIQGPEDFAESITDSATFDDLVPGDYDIAADSVEDDDQLEYNPVDEQTTVSLDEGDSQNITVEYVEGELPTGAIDIEIEGLADDATPTVELIDDDTVVDSISGAGSFEDVEIGSYTISGSDYDDNGSQYVSDEQDVTVESDATADVTLDYEVITGGVDVTVDGLPSGADPTVELVDGTTVIDSRTGSGTFDDVTPGSYTVVGGDYDDSGAQYTTDDESVTVTSDTTTDVSLDYNVIDGQLEVIVDGLDITGLPQADADVTVSGSTTEFVGSAGTTTFDLEPGSYDIIAEDTSQGPATFTADDDTATVESNSTTTVHVDYSVIEGELFVGETGLPDGGDFEATITGPDVNTTITSESTFNDILPGEYHVEYESYSTGLIIYDPEPDETDVTVQSGESTNAIADYVEREGELEINIILPDSVNVDLIVEDDTGSEVASYTADDSGLETFDLAPGTYRVVTDGTLQDQWNNDFEFDGTDEYFDIASGQTHSQNISTQLPTLVTTEVDDINEYGSLREVVDRVNDHSEITFDQSSVQQIELGSTIEIDQPLSVIGPGDPEDLVVTQEFGSSDRLFDITLSGNSGDEVLFQQLRFADVSGADGPVARIVGDSIDVIFFDVELHNNESSIWGGGAVYVRNPSESVDLHFQDALFSDNHAPGGGGGALRVSNGQDVDIHIDIADSVFDSNTSDEEGGALRIVEFVELHLDNVVFEQNFADTDGGALWAGDDAEVEMTDVEFDNNEASDDGGAVYVSGTLDADLVTATENDGSWGGAFFLDDTNGSITRSYFGNNSAARGGAVYAQDTGYAESSNFLTTYYPFEIEQTLFEGNSSSSWGGALRAQSSDDDIATRLDVTNSTFSENSGSSAGAVLWHDGANGTISFTTMVENSGNSFGSALRVQNNANSLSMKANYMADNIGSDSELRSYGPAINSFGYNVIDSLDGAHADEFDDEASDMINVQTAFSSLNGTGDYTDTHTVYGYFSNEGRLSIPASECTALSSNRFSFSSLERVRILVHDQAGDTRPSGDACTSGASATTTSYENFEDADLPTSFSSGSFDGVDGNTWNYQDARDEGTNSVYGRPGVWLEAEGSEISTDFDIDPDSMSIIYRAAGPQSDGDRQIRVLADGSVVDTSDTFDDGTHIMVIDDFENWDDFELTIQNNAPDIDGGIVIDQVSWR